MQLSCLRTIKPKTPQQQIILNAGDYKDSNGLTQQREYVLGKHIGNGRITKIYEAADLITGRKVAIKIIPKSSVEDPQAKQKLVSEINIHKALDHKSILKLEHAFEDIDNIYMILELCTNKNLEATVKNRQLSESEVQKLLPQLVGAMKYLHGRKIIHRNIKLPNIFLTDNNEVRLGGFRLATKLESVSDRKFSVCGNIDFVAPEVVSKAGHSTQADIWSFGVLTYQLLFGKLPFKDASDSKTVSRIKQNKFTFPPEILISSAAKDFITNILVLKPESRLSLWEISQHPFLNPNRSPLKDSFTDTFTSACQSTLNSELMKRTSGFLSSKNSIRSMTSLSSQTTKHSNRIADPSLWSLNGTPKKEGETARNPKVLRKAFTFSEPTNHHVKTEFSPISSKTDTSDVMTLPSDFDITDFQEKEPSFEEEPEIGLCVVKWIDYSSKYGLGYMLSDNSLGVIFNDTTQILDIPSSQNFLYFSEASIGRRSQGARYNFNDYPNSLERKMKIYKYFKDYLQQNKSGVSTLKNIVTEPSKGSNKVWNISINKTQRDNDQEPANGFVQTWMKTDNAIFFKLNTKFVQVVFKDEATLMINPHAKNMVYVCGIGIRKCFKVNDPKLEKTDDVSKRVGYAQKRLKEAWRAVSSIEI